MKIVKYYNLCYPNTNNPNNNETWKPERRANTINNIHITSTFHPKQHRSEQHTVPPPPS